MISTKPLNKACPLPGRYAVACCGLFANRWVRRFSILLVGLLVVITSASTPAEPISSKDQLSTEPTTAALRRLADQLTGSESLMANRIAPALWNLMLYQDTPLITPMAEPISGWLDVAAEPITAAGPLLDRWMRHMDHYSGEDWSQRFEQTGLFQDTAGLQQYHQLLTAASIASRQRLNELLDPNTVNHSAIDEAIKTLDTLQTAAQGPVSVRVLLWKARLAMLRMARSRLFRPEQPKQTDRPDLSGRPNRPNRPDRAETIVTDLLGEILSRDGVALQWSLQARLERLRAVAIREGPEAAEVLGPLLPQACDWLAEQSIDPATTRAVQLRLAVLLAACSEQPIEVLTDHLRRCPDSAETVAALISPLIAQQVLDCQPVSRQCLAGLSPYQLTLAARELVMAHATPPNDLDAGLQLMTWLLEQPELLDNQPLVPTLWYLLGHAHLQQARTTNSSSAADNTNNPHAASDPATAVVSDAAAYQPVLRYWTRLVEQFPTWPNPTAGELALASVGGSDSTGTLPAEQGGDSTLPTPTAHEAVTAGQETVTAEQVASWLAPIASAVGRQEDINNPELRELSLRAMSGLVGRPDETGQGLTGPFADTQTARQWRYHAGVLFQRAGRYDMAAACYEAHVDTLTASQPPPTRATMGRDGSAGHNRDDSHSGRVMAQAVSCRLMAGHEAGKRLELIAMLPEHVSLIAENPRLGAVITGMMPGWLEQWYQLYAAGEFETLLASLAEMVPVANAVCGGNGWPSVVDVDARAEQSNQGVYREWLALAGCVAKDVSTGRGRAIESAPSFLADELQPLLRQLPDDSFPPAMQQPDTDNREATLAGETARYATPTPPVPAPQPAAPKATAWDSVEPQAVASDSAISHSKASQPVTIRQLRTSAMLAFARGDYERSRRLWYRLRAGLADPEGEASSFLWWQGRYFGLRCLLAQGKAAEMTHALEVLQRSRGDDFLENPWYPAIKKQLIDPLKKP